MVQKSSNSLHHKKVVLKEGDKWLISPSSERIKWIHCWRRWRRLRELFSYCISYLFTVDDNLVLQHRVLWVDEREKDRCYEGEINLALWNIKMTKKKDFTKRETRQRRVISQRTVNTQPYKLLFIQKTKEGEREREGKRRISIKKQRIINDLTCHDNHLYL